MASRIDTSRLWYRRLSNHLGRGGARPGGLSESDSVVKERAAHGGARWKI